MKKRFRNVECCKGAALLFVVIYHYWVLSGSIHIPIPGLDTLIFLGGEIGVTMFFVLSGLGIYCLFRNTGVKSWGLFVRSRFLKIAPLYYFSIILVISLTPAGGGYLSESGFLDIVTHALFIHNFWVAFHGGINGGLWTMGVIFQFYFIAVFLYKCIEKNRHITVFFSILGTILVKIVMYKYLLQFYGVDGTLYYIYGRQLFSALDNFVLGMYAGTFIWKNRGKVSGIAGVSCLMLLVAMLIIWGKCGFRYGIYGINISSYLWHSVLAVITFGVVVVSGMMKEVNQRNFLWWIGQNEYGIYLLHLPILRNMLQTPLFQKFISLGYNVAGCICFLLFSFGVGYVFNHTWDFVKETGRK